MASFDVLIAGGGMAGCCAAFALSRAGRSVCLVEARAPGAGASGAAAGLANPFMGRKANPTWRLASALDGLQWITRAAGARDTFAQTGVLRPARSEKQAGFFQERAAEHPQHAQWLGADAAREHTPAVEAPHGALWTPSGGAVDVPAFLTALLSAARDAGATVETSTRLTGWTADADGLTATVERGDDSEALHAGRLLLCVGQGFGALAPLGTLGLRAVKGQTLRLRRPAALAEATLPTLSGNGYVAPQPDGTLLVGSTYEHDFTDLETTDEGRRYILGKVSQMLPALADADVLAARAGARVSPHGSHLPAVGPLPKPDGTASERVWAFTGLGSRGLLTAPQLARELPDFLDDPSRIPEAVRARRSAQ